MRTISCLGRAALALGLTPACYLLHGPSRSDDRPAAPPELPPAEVSEVRPAPDASVAPPEPEAPSGPACMAARRPIGIELESPFGIAGCSGDIPDGTRVASIDAVPERDGLRLHLLNPLRIDPGYDCTITLENVGTALAREAAFAWRGAVTGTVNAGHVALAATWMCCEEEAASWLWVERGDPESPQGRFASVELGWGETTCRGTNPETGCHTERRALVLGSAYGDGWPSVELDEGESEVVAGGGVVARNAASSAETCDGPPYAGPYGASWVIARVGALGICTDEDC